MKKPLVSEVTEIQISDWKEKHEVIKRADLTLKDKSIAPFIIGKPTRSHLDAIAKYTNDNKPNKVREVLESNCILAGDDELLKDPSIANTLYERITDMLEKLEVEEKEL